ncbi:MAG: DUF1922 domain-containing protein [Candidatus Kariarchaeaceae archaeon]|jgi:hypothetical protein
MKEWSVVQCSRLECSKYMVTKSGTKTKKCPYCGRTFKIAEAYVSSHSEQNSARGIVQSYNNKL